MSNKTILLVDDDNQLLKVVEIHLSRIGYNVITSQSGNDALAKFKQAESLIDVVIVDLIMDGTNGIHVLRQVKEHRPTVKVMIFTAYGDLESAIESLRFKADDYLLKPFDLSELDSRIANFFTIKN